MLHHIASHRATLHHSHIASCNSTSHHSTSHEVTLPHHTTSHHIHYTQIAQIKITWHKEIYWTTHITCRLLFVLREFHEPGFDILLSSFALIRRLRKSPQYLLVLLRRIMTVSAILRNNFRTSCAEEMSKSWLAKFPVLAGRSRAEHDGICRFAILGLMRWSILHALHVLHVCICMCMCVYIYRERERERDTHIHACIYIYIYIYTHTHTHVLSLPIVKHLTTPICAVCYKFVLSATKYALFIYATSFDIW